MGCGVLERQLSSPRAARCLSPTSSDHPAVVGLQATTGTEKPAVAFEHEGWGGRIGRFQIPQRAVLSHFQVTTQRLSGLKATAKPQPSWPLSTTGWAAGSAAFKSHSRAVLSQLPVTTQRLSGLKATAVTHPSWPLSTTGWAAGSAAFKSHSARCCPNFR